MKSIKNHYQITVKYSMYSNNKKKKTTKLQEKCIQLVYRYIDNKHSLESRL